MDNETTEEKEKAKRLAIIKRSRKFFPFTEKFETSIIKAFAYADKIRFSGISSKEHECIVKQGIALCRARGLYKLEIELMCAALLLERFSKEKPWREMEYNKIKHLKNA